jgi:hypothetical protein
MTSACSLRRMHVAKDAEIDERVDLLIDCVEFLEGDASASFVHPLNRDRRTIDMRWK